MDAAGSGRTGQDLDEGELERIRQRILREAEENFKLEIRKLRGEVIEQLVELLQLHFGGLVMAWQRCQLLDKEIAVVLWSMGGLPGAGAQGGFGESLKSQELPAMPAPGVEGASLAFGDWLALASPQMSDIGAISRDWWIYVLQQVEEHYERWLVSGPVDRLRLRPG
ncbi:unnamed protein product, partial [Cladocopium goreaui]